MSAIAYIGIGSNDGARLHNCRTALNFIGQDNEIEVKRVSMWYESEALSPSGAPSDQRNYINGVVEIVTELGARELLSYLLATEVKMGRPRTRPKGKPRTIDLDLLLYGTCVIDEEGMVVPHPALAKRMFVLTPLCDIAPGAVEPRTGLTARQMADACSVATPQRITHLGEHAC